LDWGCISGFFDGEGGITIDAPKGSRVLVMNVTIAQKNKEVLEIIQTFLAAQGIGSRILVLVTRVYSLKIWRIKDIISFLSHLTLTVKARQVETTLRYYQGNITGNELLSIFKEEYLVGRRRHPPFLSREWNFHLTHKEALRLAGLDRSKAAQRARNCLEISDIREMVMKLPTVFGVQDVMRVFGVPKTRASYLVRLMRRNGFVVGNLHYHSNTRTLVCRRQI
jgi:hypothetical protein